MSKKQTEVIVNTAGGGYAQTIQLGEHTIQADEPVSVGGTGTGPDPYELLLASLGACTSMTVQMFAKRKNWPLEGVSVRLRHAKIHAEDCSDCETSTGYVDVIEKQVEFTGELSDEQRNRLLEISERCPVHRTLLSEVKIRSVQAGPEGNEGT